MSTSNLVGDVYELDVIPPPVRGAVDYVIGGRLVLDLPTTFIAEQLAREYGAQKEGDEIQLTIRQRSHLTLNIHEFDPIPVCVRFALPRLGLNYLQIGMDDVQRFFDVALCQPKPNTPFVPFLFLEPKRHYRHWCRELP